MKILNPLKIHNKNLRDLYSERNKVDYCNKKNKSNPSSPYFLVYCEYKVINPFHKAISKL